MFGHTWILLCIHGFFLVGICILLILQNRGVRWYYRLGPALLSEEWQSSTNEDTLKRELDRFKGAGNLIVYHWKDGLGFRLRSSKLHKFARATITTRSADAGAILQYQVRVSFAYPALHLLFCCAWGFYSRFHIPWGSWMFALIALFWAYSGFLRNTAAVKELGRLGELRRHLQHLGVNVCCNCGYDLFQHESTCICPECGFFAGIARPRV